MTSRPAATAAMAETDADVCADGDDLVRAIAGPEIEALFRSHRTKLVGAMARRTGDHEAASDLVQESFLRLLRLGEATSLLARPQAYLMRIATNLATDLRKRQARRSTALHVVADETTLPSFDPHAQLESRDMLRRVEAAMLRLPDRTREIFVAHRVEGLSYAEIAERTGLTVKGVEKQMSRALVRLDRLVARG